MVLISYVHLNWNFYCLSLIWFTIIVVTNKFNQINKHQYIENEFRSKKNMKIWSETKRDMTIIKQLERL